MFNFRVYEWYVNDCVAWTPFDNLRRRANCHGEASQQFFGSGTYRFYEGHSENNESTRVYLYGDGTGRIFKFVKVVDG